MNDVARLRKVLIKDLSNSLTNIRVGYFHRWCDEPYYASDDRYITKTFGLVEREDGKIELVEPEMLRFEVKKEKKF